MSSLSLYFVILWYVLKPLLFVIIPTMLLGEMLILNRRTRRRSNMC